MSVVYYIPACTYLHQPTALFCMCFVIILHLFGLICCGAMRCGAVRCDAVRCGAIRCGVVRCGASDLMWCVAVQCRTGGMALLLSTVGDRRMSICYLGRLGDTVDFAALPASTQADQIAHIVG